MDALQKMFKTSKPLTPERVAIAKCAVVWFQNRNHSLCLTPQSTNEAEKWDLKQSRKLVL